MLTTFLINRPRSFSFSSNPTLLIFRSFRFPFTKIIFSLSSSPSSFLVPLCYSSGNHLPFVIPHHEPCLLPQYQHLFTFCVQPYSPSFQRFSITLLITSKRVLYFPYEPETTRSFMTVIMSVASKEKLQEDGGWWNWVVKSALSDKIVKIGIRQSEERTSITLTGCCNNDDREIWAP